MEKKLPEGWEWKRLGDAAELIMGQSPPGDTYNEIDQGMPFLQGKSEFGDVSPEHVKYTTKPLKIAPKGSVLMSVRAPVGDVNIANIDYCIGRGLSSLSLYGGENAFLFYVLNYFKNKIEKKGTGSTFKAITKSKLQEFKIPLPPIETQRKIVAILEKADETKKLRMQADELASQLLQSVFFDVFGDSMKNLKGWKIVTLEDTCKLIRDGEHRTPTYVKEGIPFVTAKNLVGEEIDLGNTKKITKEEHADFCKRAKPEKSDLLMSKDGTIGVTRVIKTGEEFSIYVSVVLLKPNNELMDSDFLRYLLSSKTIQAEIVKRSRGIGLKHIHLVDLRSLKIPLPPLNIQKNFSKVVETVEAMRQNQKQSQQEIDNLFNALMQKAFKGELVA
jgi:type I restriction enzyme S subunit